MAGWMSVLFFLSAPHHFCAKNGKIKSNFKNVEKFKIHSRGHRENFMGRSKIGHSFRVGRNGPEAVIIIIEQRRGFRRVTQGAGVLPGDSIPIQICPWMEIKRIIIWCISSLKRGYRNGEKDDGNINKSSINLNRHQRGCHLQLERERGIPMKLFRMQAIKVSFHMEAH